MGKGARYAVITPARDEGRYIGGLARSLLAQTVPFDVWVVVDDGSTDDTQQIISDLAAREERIRLIVREGRKNRRAGTGGIEAAGVGLAELDDPLAYDYVALLDGDLTLPRDYFERLFAEFERDSRLGIAGGHIFTRTDRGLEFDNVPDDHVHGATKTYRNACLRSIWPLEEVWAWDTVDECRAQMAGWRTRSLRDAVVIHEKPTTACAGSPLRGRFFIGRTCYYLGYRPDYLLVRAVRNLGMRPYILAGVALAAGYLWSALMREERFEDAELRRYLRDKQLERMRGLLRVPNTVSSEQSAADGASTAVRPD
jgi:biofilm PGA synthesis N-glycosyltransferase PgaC